MKPLIPWPGGKTRLASSLLPLFPEHTCYVEPFAGAAALLFARPEPAAVEVINDLNGELVRMYRCVAHHLEEFVRQFRWALSSREMFRWLQLQHLETLTDIQRGARFFYLQQLSFAGKVEGQTFGYSTTSPPGLNLLRIEEALSAAHLRLARVTIEHQPWAAMFDRYDRPHSFFFCDPPYWETQGYGIEFGLDQYEALAQRMRSAKGKVLLTVNDHPKMRSVFGEFTRSRASIRYSMGNRTGKPKTSSELIVRNW